ncbi:MAG: preprotein translocase subunit SecY [Candidatus Doudnabacteria bacterium RIFCSPHIGHO2_12_FULL_48_11]|uniref:Protein translocase subunit SecY n=1 Tax=Candidatus Doudnabacteria bacterium RIFCSPHIGHO2_01_FULL_46_24 TaxID=1817825 RepID=A0A1F5NUX5_9BACT|nr:MAG: preprotein translocase subunit SecY [Candidatus Doudnabacteria bacterium RIFCSPHIGHO2_01_FULL_46_24]OGE95923.1 MAG: preprotein translocase subunit SecY [Candidatus Doudnabacteria bacterium RIFCSPHIGHO2_12_FULL_48_11]
MSRLSQLWKVKDLRNRILFVALLLIGTRILANIPIPGVELANLRNLLNSNQLFGLFNIFSGGGLQNFSVAMLGVGPYITASIIMQLLTIIVPKLGELAKEGGEAGRAKINQYTRWLTVPLTVLQGYGTIILLTRTSGSDLITEFSAFQWFVALLSITAGSMLLLWLGELITEYKLGNGVSMIIFAGIVSQLPPAIQQGYVNLTTSTGQLSSTGVVTAVGFLAVAFLVIAAIVGITEAQRNIPVSYAKRVRGNKLYGGVSTHLPLRVNQAGVIPIIFAISILLFPGLIANFFSQSRTPQIASFAASINDFFQNQTYYGIMYFLLVVAFTYFYTAIVFNPDEIADNIQKQGGFVPGLRPGRQTAEFLYKVLNRITLVGALFLGLIAVLPYIIQSFTKTSTLTLGGTGILIVVAVVIEIINQVKSQMIMRDYENF